MAIVKEHLNSSGLTFCFFDYDIAIQLPKNASLYDTRRPAWEGDCGSVEFHPRDIYLGQPEYNPFAFDVACLGNLFLYNFTVCILCISCSSGLTMFESGRHINCPPAGTSLRRNDNPCCQSALHRRRSFIVLRRAHISITRRFACPSTDSVLGL